MAISKVERNTWPKAGKPVDDRRVHRTLTLEQVFEAGRRAGMERPNIGLRSDETVDEC